MRVLTCLYAAAMASLASPAMAEIVMQDREICPISMITLQDAVGTPEGWTAKTTTRPEAFRNITFFDGPPVEMAALAPDNEGKDSATAIWTFDPASSNRIFVSCGYEDTQVSVERQLVPGVKKCTVNYETDEQINGYPQISSDTCEK